MLRGAAAEILTCIANHVAAGKPTISYATMHAETHYSLPTIHTTIKQLEYQHFIRIQPGKARQANSYQILSPVQRHTRQLARELGLIQ